MKSIYYLAIAATAVVTAACSAKRTISRSGLPQMVPDTVLLVNNNGMVDLNMSIIIQTPRPDGADSGHCG